MNDTPIDIYTDGACLHNPHGNGGYGIVIVADSIITFSGHIPSPTTNNRAEIIAALYGVTFARLHGYTNLKVFSDSNYVIKTMQKLFKRNKNKDLWDVFDIVVTTGDVHVEFHWVKGHNTNKYNNLADSLAKKGTKKYE